MTINNNFFIAAFCFISFPFVCSGQQAQDQNYTLFNPVPRALMREMETDRPDVTESPYTVDAGHFQYETDIIRIIHEKSESKQTNTLLVNQANLKIGITRTTAIQIGFQTFGRQKEKELSSGAVTTQSGFGDINLRIKQNLIGNDHGNFVLALLPYIKFPTSKFEDDSRFEGGLIVPMLYKLPGEWTLGLQVEADRLKDKDEQAMHTEFLQSLTLSHPIVKGVDGIVETYYTYDFKAHQLSNFINAAVQVDVIKDFKLDAGLNYGIQNEAGKHYFIGASYRY
ncbi:Putative MetA-pathway of phenol degradation [Chryseobacterium soldanellicola]|uniref:Putative MetA-pathway of phenol degradation n=1 Tax=Chryseobacterium soldanellicola TaxID=311333 RepID=A0A1H0XMC1_9FLAO|nr:transporter [Chryseobacterium soldanellicola]SDQ04065.1 Putative MetA-pathway of phenol degradation [Chryseobacterium soldanellicola]